MLMIDLYEVKHSECLVVRSINIKVFNLCSTFLVQNIDIFL